MAESTAENAVGSDLDGPSEPGLAGMLIRDIAVILAALSVWAAADTWHQATGLWLAEAVAVGDAILVGLLLASLFHEWGHYAGAASSGASTTRVAPVGLSFFRFNFNYADNDLRQFHWMTYGGHVLHWSILILLLIAIPLDSLGRIALVSAVFGFVVFATFIEVNILRQTFAGEDPESVLNALTTEDIKKAGAVGTIGGLLAIAALH